MCVYSCTSYKNYSALVILLAVMVTGSRLKSIWPTRDTSPMATSTANTSMSQK